MMGTGTERLGARALAIAFTTMVGLAGISPAHATDLNGAPEEEADIGPAAHELRRNWNGFYVGGLVAADHGVWTVDFYRNNNHGHAASGLDGLGLGGYVGYNVHLSPRWVAGLEADLVTSNASQNNEIFDNDDTLAEYGLHGSVRGRVGYLLDRLMLYGTAGYAFMNLSENIQKGQNAGEQVVYEDQTVGGFVIGAGAEYQLASNWIGRIEYLYSNYGTYETLNADGNLAIFENELHEVRVGVSYKF